MANAYAALANGGILWTPRVVSSIVDSQGTAIVVNVPRVLRAFDISAATVASLRSDLHGVVAAQNGTAYSAFVGFGDSLDRVGGKTGTAQIRLASRRLVVDRDLLPAERQGELVSRLAELLEVSPAEIRERFDTEDARFAVANDISETTASFVEQDSWEFPGLVIEDVPEVDTAWFVGVAPLDAPQFVVAVLIDGGGSGGKIAAPTARAILQYLMGEDVDTIRSGEDTD